MAKPIRMFEFKAGKKPAGKFAARSYCETYEVAKKLGGWIPGEKLAAEAERHYEKLEINPVCVRANAISGLVKSGALVRREVKAEKQSARKKAA